MQHPSILEERRTPRSLRLAALVFAAGCAGGDDAAADPPVEWPVADGAGPLEAAACPPPAGLAGAECATLSVPERWGEPEGRRIPLRIAILRATEGGSPSTPPGFGETAVERLSRSRHVVIPGGTHIHRSACLDRVVEEFFATAEPESLDVSCLEDSARPPFFLGDPPPPR